MVDPERLYVDLVFRASKKYANWDPEVSIEVGDYGRITAGHKSWIRFWRREQGTFLKEGNIYTDGQAEKWKIPPPKEHGTESNEGQTWVTSKNAHETDVDVAAGGQTPALAQCKVKASFKFTSGQGAVLVMDNDTVSTIDPPGVLRRLLDDESMKGLVIVSEAHKSSSFARLLTAEGTSNIAIGLSVEPPVSGAVSGTADAKWVRSSSAGNFKSKVNKDGKRVFTPLFRLVSLDDREVSTGMRGGDDEVDPPLPEASPPWFDEEEPEEESSDAQEEDDPTEKKKSKRSRLSMRLFKGKAKASV